LIHNFSSEISPVCAITGGFLGQEIIKIISNEEEPYKNFFVYNGLDTLTPGQILTI